MRTAGPRRATAAAVALFATAAILALAACGSDDERTTPQPATNPATSEQTSTESTSTESTSTSEGDGGVEAGDDSGGHGGDNTSSEGGSGGAAVPDTPENDVTPPANTPQGQFEQYCNQNPGACG